MSASALARRANILHSRIMAWRSLVGLAIGGLVVYLIVVPLGVLFFSSIRATKGVLPFEATSFTLSNYLDVYSSPTTYKLLSNTVLYGGMAIVIGLGLAIAFAWFIERTNAPAPSTLVVLVLAPLGVPAIVEAMAWILLANPTNGLLNVTLRGLLDLSGNGPLSIYSVLGMGWVSGLKMVPSAYVLVASLMANMDPALEESSLVSGVSPITTFRRITASLLRPGILAAAIYFGVLVFELFEIPAMLGMPVGIYVFSTLIFESVHPHVGLPDYGLASAYAAINIIAASSLIYLYHRMVRRQEKFAVVTGRGYRARRVEVRQRWRVLFTGAIGLYVLLAALLPVLVLVWASLGILYTPLALGAVDLRYYVELFSIRGITRTLINTLIITVSSATATMVVAFITSLLSLRSRVRGGAFTDRLTILSVAMPSVLIALALSFFYGRIPLPIYGTVWIIVIAFVTRFLAFGSRLMSAAYVQIHKEIEEASETSGASWWITITRIVLPLLWPAFARGWLWVFVYALRDVSLALMLFTVDNDTIGVRLWNLWVQNANFELGAAMAVPLIVFSLGLSLLVSRRTIVHGGA